MYRKKLALIALALVMALVAIANGPPTDPDGEVVFAPYGPEPIVTFTIPLGDGPEILPPADDSLLLISEGDAEAAAAELEQALNANASLTQQTGVSCSAGASSPNKINATQVQGAGAVVCTGSVAQTKLIYALQRHLWGPWWSTIRHHNSGWRNVTSIIISLPGSCASGTHTYRVVADGYGRTSTGNTDHDQAVSSHSQINC